jgi:hypothetical protein
MDLTEPQFFALSKLFAVRSESIKSRKLDSMMRSLGYSIQNWERFFAEINAKAESILGGPIVHVLGRGEFRLADPARNNQSVPEVEFAIHESGQAVILHGKVVLLSQNQMKLLELVARKKTLTYESMSKAFGWPKGNRYRAGAMIGRINRITERRMATHILKLIPQRGVALDVHAPVVLPKRAQHLTDAGELELTGSEERAFQNLKHKEFPLRSDLFISTKIYLAMGLPASVLIRALRGINLQFENLYGRELLRRVELEFSYGTNEVYIWKSNRFSEATHIYAKRYRILNRKPGCARYLNVSENRTGVPDWQLID